MLTTHYLEEADRLASQLAIVDRGRVVATGTPDGLKGQLRGDAVQVELPPDADAGLVRSVLADLPEVRDVVIAGRNVSARSDDGAAAVPVVLGALQRAGINASSVAVARPSLDDVYLRHTGRRYSESESPDGHEARDERNWWRRASNGYRATRVRAVGHGDPGPRSRRGGPGRDRRRRARK